MEKRNDFNENFVNTCFYELTKANFDFTSKEEQDKVKNLFIYILTYQYFVNVDDVFNYLDYDLIVEDNGECLTLKANNIITALWFLNIFPNNLDKINRENMYHYNGKKYIFENYKLTIENE